MNTDEELLARALNRAADRITPEGLRPLATPSRAHRVHRPWGRLNTRLNTWNMWLAPAAAALAVILVVTLALAATSGSPSPGRSGPATGTRAPSIGGAPKYYAEVEGKFIRWHGPNSIEVVVRSTATGAVVARIPNPVIEAAPKVLPLSVAAGPNDRTFYAIYANWGRVPGDFWIYRFAITPPGTATGLTRVNGGLVTGSDYVGNVGGFVVSPDGSRLALAVSATANGNTAASAVAGEILVIDLRTGAHAVWRGGVDRHGQVFGIVNLSWTSDGESLAYLGQWCPPRDISYGPYGGFTCATIGDYQHPSQDEGSQAVRKVSVTGGGGTLDSGPVLLQSSARHPFLGPTLITPDGTELTSIVTTGSGISDVVRISVATGDITSVIGRIPTVPSLGGDYLAADRTGNYLLVWMSGNADSGLPLHGWVHGGTYRQLTPTFPPSYPGGWYQMAW